MDEFIIPKNISEEAVQELINLWKMRYAPESTVDPSSEGVPMGKAVYELFRSNWITNRIIVEDNNPHVVVDVSGYTYYPTGNSNTSFEKLDLTFIPKVQDNYIMHPVCFSGVRYSLVCAGSFSVGELGTLTNVQNPVALEWEAYNLDGYNKLYRTAVFFRNKDNKNRPSLWVSGLDRTRILNNGTIEAWTSPTEDQLARCQVSALDIFKPSGA